MTHDEKVEKFLALLKAHPYEHSDSPHHFLKERGVWEIYGIDAGPGGDLFSLFSIGLYEGQFEDVINLAVEQPSFWHFNGVQSGKIVQRHVMKVG